ncbi:MAG TPA: hypothetical protein VF101_07700 [Gaiellaceae bacterium]
MGALLAVVAGLVLAVARPGSGGASASLVGDHANGGGLPPERRDAILRGAREDGVDPATVVAAATAGPEGAAVAALVGTGFDGRVRVSFFHGFGMTAFQPPGHLFARGEQLALSEGYSGPQHEPVRVVVVGAARPTVSRVEIELADGRTVDAALNRRAGFGFFAYVGASPTEFPTFVRAFAGGVLVQTHEIPKL